MENIYIWSINIKTWLKFVQLDTSAYFPSLHVCDNDNHRPFQQIPHSHPLTSICWDKLKKFMVSSITFPIDNQKETKGEKQKRKITLSYFSWHYIKFIFLDEYDYERKAPKIEEAKIKSAFSRTKCSPFCYQSGNSWWIYVPLGKFLLQLKGFIPRRLLRYHTLYNVSRPGLFSVLFFPVRSVSGLVGSFSWMCVSFHDMNEIGRSENMKS